jgi:hypothetical protein
MRVTGSRLCTLLTVAALTLIGASGCDRFGRGKDDGKEESKEEVDKTSASDESEKKPVKPVEPVPSATATAVSAPVQPAGDFRVGQKVQVQWKAKWWPATVRSVQPTCYGIHYDGWGSEWDECVIRARIR